MADISDVEKALVDTIVTTVYPAGTSNMSLIGSDVRIYRGWPSPERLSIDLQNGVVNISVFSDSKSGRETTRYPRVWKPGTTMVPTLTVQLVNGAATFGGVGGAGQNAGVLVDGIGYSVAVGIDDTPQTVAEALARLVNGAIAENSSLHVPGSAIAAARVEGSSLAQQETRRQEQAITVTLWCADPDVRDRISASIDAALSEIDWLALPDGSSARLLYKSTSVSDSSENADLYRRDLIYSTEYPTIIQQIASAMVFGTANISLTQDVTENATPSFTLIGAIRFEAWYDPTSPIDQQCAEALSVDSETSAKRGRFSGWICHLASCQPSGCRRRDHGGC